MKEAHLQANIAKLPNRVGKEISPIYHMRYLLFPEKTGVTAGYRSQLEHFAGASVLSPREIMPAECMVRGNLLHVTMLLSSLMQCDSVRGSEVQANLPKQLCSRKM